MYLKNNELIERFLFCNSNLIKNYFNSNKSISLYDNDEGIYELYSYDEIISKRNLEDNIIVIFGKTKMYGNFYSKTTSKHIGNLINKCLEEDIPHHIITYNNN
jgi:CRISPR/Cas system Type II protein with McrA/HNH and RuvC-like nuclease domain